MSDLVEIYGLIDPRTGIIRYIGKANDSLLRLKSHLRDSKTRNTPVYFWIRKLNSIGLHPEIKVLSVVGKEDWKSEEIKIIKEYKNNGFKLLNVATGGDEPFCSKEQRAINGKNVSFSIHSDPIKKKLWSHKKDIASILSTLKRLNQKEAYNKIILKIKSMPHIFTNNYQLWQ